MEETLMAAPMSRDAQRTGAPAAAATSGAGAARTERWSWTLPPRKEKALNCRRCNSDSTMFCYYTNYSLTRPRHYCKTCRRYWIEGARRRNAPVGGGARGKKDRRPRSPAAAAASSSPGAVPNGGVSTGVEASRACVFPAMELVVRSAAAGGYVPPRHGSATGEVVRMAPPPQSESVVLGFSLGTPGARGVPGGGGLQEAAAGWLLLPFEHLSLAPRREAQREEIDGDQGGDGGAFLRR